MHVWDCTWMCVFLFLLQCESAGLSWWVRVCVVTMTYRHTDRGDGGSARCILGKVWQEQCSTQTDVIGFGFVCLWWRLSSGRWKHLKGTLVVMNYISWLNTDSFFKLWFWTLMHIYHYRRVFFKIYKHLLLHIYMRQNIYIYIWGRNIICICCVLYV